MLGRRTGQGRMRKQSPSQKLIILIPFFILTLGVFFVVGFLFAFPPNQLPENFAASTNPITTDQTQPIITNTSTLEIYPTLTPAPTTTSVPASFTYVVKPGDTLSSIASQFDTTIHAIKLVNELNGDLIYDGQTLTITLQGSQIQSLLTPNTLPTNAQAEQGFAAHLVSSGETLENLADKYSVPIENIRSFNYMIGDTILPGQQITIPLTNTHSRHPWRFSILGGDLASFYPLSLETDRFTLHFAPETYPGQDPLVLANLVQQGLKSIETLMQVKLDVHFDIFAAGSVFAPPNRALRGRSFSYLRQTFFLHDGTGNPEDQLYIVTHELTHLFAWNAFGQPASSMLSEGAAVYAGMKSIEGSNHLPLNRFCEIYIEAEELPQVSSSLSFQGHIRDLENYYAAGCFVGYLIENYGTQSFAQLYPTGDFGFVYGKSINEIEEEWRSYLNTNDSTNEGDFPDFISSVNDIKSAYENFFSSFTGSNTQIAVYRELDKARIALLQGRLESFNEHMNNFHILLGTQ
jgi:LysM repeat protein